MNYTIVITGPSGSGKSTLANHLCSKYGVQRIKQHTTRKPRKFDEDKDEYLFIDDLHMDNLATNGSFVDFKRFEKHQGNSKSFIKYGRLRNSFFEPGIKVLTTNIESSYDIYADEELRDKCLFVIMKRPVKDCFANTLARNQDSLEECIRRSLMEKELYYDGKGLPSIDGKRCLFDVAVVDEESMWWVSTEHVAKTVLSYRWFDDVDAMAVDILWELRNKVSL